MAMLALAFLSTALASTQTPGLCKNVGGLRFGASPPEDRVDSLPVCGSFSHNTCCNLTNFEPVLLPYRILQAGRVSDACLAASEVAHCYACHPDVGVGKVNTICPSVCDDWFSACKQEYYEATEDGRMHGCLDSSIICSRLGDIVSDGRALCERFDFKVAVKEGDACYSGAVPVTKGRSPASPPAFDLSSLFPSGSMPSLPSSFLSPSPLLTFSLLTAVLFFLGRALWVRYRRQHGAVDIARRMAILAAAEGRRKK